MKTVIGGIELIPSFKLAKVAIEKRYLRGWCENFEIKFPLQFFNTTFF
jgi:hypothetical protein